jgi:uncharacterized coiled-coil DUF342 family protein
MSKTLHEKTLESTVKALREQIADMSADMVEYAKTIKDLRAEKEEAMKLAAQIGASKSYSEDNA